MRFAGIVLAAVLAGGVSAQTVPAASAAAPAPAAIPLPEGTGQKLVATTCGQCHDLATVTSTHQNQADWQATVESMNDRGAGLDSGDLTMVVAYLTKNFGPAPAPPADPLPEGTGKALVADACSQCHTLDRVVSRKMDHAGWQGTVDDMISRGADLSSADEATVVAYLAEHFGKAIAHQR